MSASPFSLISLLVGVAFVGRGYLPAPAKMLATFGQGSQAELASSCRFRLGSDNDLASRLASAALRQVGRITDHDTSYRKIGFPGGDVPAHIATNADFIVRAYRGVGIDLQERVFTDKTASPGAYPRRAGSSAADPNIDHREVSTLAAFFNRCGARLPLTRNPDDYRPGDIVTCIAEGRQHIALVVPSPFSGSPWLVHNLHWGARLEDKLFEYTITGHYRYLPGF